QLLYSEVADLADIEDVLRAAIDRVDRAELFQELARAAKLANDRSIQAHLVDLARGIEIVRGIQIRHVHHLVGPRSDADRLRIADVSDLGLEDAVVVEHLDAVVATIGRVDVALSIDGDTVDRGELAGGAAPL